MYKNRPCLRGDFLSHENPGNSLLESASHAAGARSKRSKRLVLVKSGKPSKLLFPFGKRRAVCEEYLREWGKRLTMIETSGSNSVVECDLAKVEVAGSNPVSRSRFCPPPARFPQMDFFQPER